MAHADASIAASDRKFEVTMMHHPSHFVADLQEAEGFFADVFGRPSVSIGQILEGVPYVRPEFPRDYSAYSLIGDVFFDSIDPRRLVLGGESDHRLVMGRELFKVRHREPHLMAIGFHVEGHAEAYRALKAAGLTLLNTFAEPQEGALPTGPNEPAPIFTLREEVGFLYEFYPAHLFPGDPRTEPGWELPPVSASDPLGIECCSHHTLLTADPEQAKRILVDILGGEVLGVDRNELLGANCTYVRLGDSTFEYAVPDEGTPAHAEWQVEAPYDTYHSLAWKVADLDRAESHLAAHGVRVRAHSETAFVTDPATSFGVPWCFSAAFLPLDPRAAA